MKPKEHDELVEHIFRVCGTSSAHVRTGFVAYTSKHSVEVDIPGGASLRIHHRVSAIATRRMIEIFRALPDGSLSIKAKRSALLAAATREVSRG